MNIYLYDSLSDKHRSNINRIEHNTYIEGSINVMNNWYREIYIFRQTLNINEFVNELLKWGNIDRLK